jgi:hypothetical protein
MLPTLFMTSVEGGVNTHQLYENFGLSFDYGKFNFL